MLIGSYQVIALANFKFCFNFKFASALIFKLRPVQVSSSVGDWKLMLIAAVHQNRIIAYQVLPKNTYVNHNIYHDFLEQHLLPEVKRQRIRSPLIIHDNARPHKHEDITNFFTRHRWTVLRHSHTLLISNPATMIYLRD